MPFQIGACGEEFLHRKASAARQAASEYHGTGRQVHVLAPVAIPAETASALADLGATRALPMIKALMKHEDEAPILRILEIAARRLERKQQP